MPETSEHHTDRMAPDLPWPRLLALAAAGGAGLAAFSFLGDGSSLRLLTVLGNLGSPWGLAAFGLGYLTTSRLRGAVGATFLLLIASGIYALPRALGGHGLGSTTLEWALVALLVGPVMGYSGGAVSARRPHPPILAVAAPSAMLVAEAVFFLWERRVWMWNLFAEPHRLTDLAIAVGFIALALWLPRLLAQGRARLLRTYSLALGGGSVAAAGLLATYRVVLSG